VSGRERAIRGVFATRLIEWQQRFGRSDLPWQGTRDAYRIWLSEVMLQQTQVQTVIPYYQRFLARFPDVVALSQAPLDEVLRLWSGLGYYARARSLHAAARVVAAGGGDFPSSAEKLARLPGVGRSTAAAIGVFAFGERAAILDGNVKRVLCRVFAVPGVPSQAAVDKRLWELAESLVPLENVERYTQGLMDLGATLCTRTSPRCSQCPFREWCEAERLGIQDRIPERARKPPVPERRTVMLVALHKGKVLLEKRPPTGVWGGLWSLPEYASFAAASRACAAAAGSPAGPPRKLAPLVHRFTHFCLTIRPLVCRIVERVSAMNEPRLAWIDVAQAEAGSVPAPVRLLLKKVQALGPS